MKTLKKISALILALAMVVAMSATVFAANSDGTQNTYKGIETSDTSISIAKQIVFINAETTDVREPNITYTYTISSAAPGTATITDKDSIVGTVKAGPMAAVTGAVTATTSTVAFADINVASASADGISTASKYATFTFDASKFIVNDTITPGIYRYKVSETSNVTKASVGITEAPTYAADRFLDVYVKWNTDRSALEIYGYVLFEGTETQSIVSTDVSMKSQGYVNTATTADDQADVDVYTTQNLHINKTTTGALADKENDFPVEITFAKATGLSDSIKLDFTVSGGGALTKTGTDNKGDYVTMDAVLNGTVDDGSKIDITGIPANSTVTMKETNNTTDSYKVKAGTTSGGENLLTEAIVAMNTKSGATSTQTFTAAQDIYITNTLEAISPTGVVLRFGPYALMLAAGLALTLALAVRRRRTDED